MRMGYGRPLFRELPCMFAGVWSVGGHAVRNKLEGVFGCEGRRNLEAELVLSGWSMASLYVRQAG